MTTPLHVVIVGGGVAGLSTAWRLLTDPELAGITPTMPADERLSGDALSRLRANLTVTVLESSERLGGNIHSQHDQGFIVEWGPNGYLDNAPETPRICRLLGIEERIQPARDAAGRRFLYVRGRLRELPFSPISFLVSDVLTARGRLRVMREPFIPGRPDANESVFQFAARRIGEEAARILVDAMVSGVYGGNARELSLVAAFPKMYALEKEHGGLVRGMLAKMREGRTAETKAQAKAKAKAGPAGPGGVLTSFDEGFEVLIHELAEALRQGGRCTIDKGTAVDDLVPSPGHRWVVHLIDGRTLAADAVVVATPARHAGTVTRSFDPDLCRTLQSIPEAPLVVVGLAYGEDDLPEPLNGFGFLVPRGQGPRSLGVLWDSCIYPNRAPQGMVLLRAMLGGAHDRTAIEMGDSEVLKTVLGDLAVAMSLTIPPRRTWILRHPQGIAQYTVGHLERLASIDDCLRNWPGLFLAGSSYRGISVNHCVEQSIPLAREVLNSPAFASF
jgi:protoporphyrinogen/coproporphyrinogen III oxidase